MEEHNLTNPITQSKGYNFYIISSDINLYSAVCIILIGLVANLLTIFLLKSKPSSTSSSTGKKQNHGGVRLSYRNRPGVQFNHTFSSSELYMLALAISDTLFLASHMFEDVLPSFPSLKPVHIVNRSNLMCKLVLYIRNSARVSSAYLVVFFAYERFTVIKSPLNRLKFHNKRFTKVVEITFFIISNSILKTLKTLNVNRL